MTNSSARMDPVRPPNSSLRCVRSRYSPGVNRVTLLSALPLKGWTTRTQNGWASVASNTSGGPATPASASRSWKYWLTLNAGRRDRATPATATAAPRELRRPRKMIKEDTSHLDLAYAEDDHGTEGHHGGGEPEHHEPPSLVHGLLVT